MHPTQLVPHLASPGGYPLLGLIPGLPLLGAAINGLFGVWLKRRFGPSIHHRIGIFCVGASAVLTGIAFVFLCHLPPDARILQQSLFPFVHVGALDADVAFWLDPLSATMALIITCIGTLIHVYAVGYMRGDAGTWRFFAFLNLFVAMMLVLVLADNFLLLFVGWEGVGLCSYLLIAFWYRDKANATAGMKAFVVNRVGDFGFILGVAALFWGLSGTYSANDGYRPPLAAGEAQILRQQSRGLAGFTQPTNAPQTSLRFAAVRARVLQHRGLWSETNAAKRLWGIPLITLVCLFFCAAACGKSAQLPLHVWLPDAMAGPTPVSALIHAATMVTAGVYLVARLNFLFALSATAMTLVTLVGALTALFAATVASFQVDIKKVLAYSTVSQLGYMFMGVGVGAYWAGVYHLLTHAVFKALLFLSAGSVITACHHQQDMRRMGGLKALLPQTHAGYFAGCVAITAAPFFFLSSGFLSKDEILWKVFDAGHLLLPGWILWAVGFAAAGLTSFYMWRSYYMTFTGTYRGQGDAPGESPRTMTTVLLILVGFIPLTLWMGFWPLVGVHPQLATWLEPVVRSANATLRWLSQQGDMHETEIFLTAASILFAALSWGVARGLYKDNASTLPQRVQQSGAAWLRGPHRLVAAGYFVDAFYHAVVVRGVLGLATRLAGFDQRVIDGLVRGAAHLGRAVAIFDDVVDALLVDGLVNGVADTCMAAGRTLRRAQNGRIQTYVLGLVAGFVLVVCVNYLLFA